MLRATRLDELPQLLNVLFGEMSLIEPGPRSATVKALTDAECRLVDHYLARIAAAEKRSCTDRRHSCGSISSTRCR